MFPLCLKGIRGGPVAGLGRAGPPAPPARCICAHRGGVSHANTQNFSLKLMTVSTARAGPLIWKRHFATRPARPRPVRPTPGSPAAASPQPGRAGAAPRRGAPGTGLATCDAGPVGGRAGRGSSPRPSAPGGSAGHGRLPWAWKARPPSGFTLE